MKTTKSLFLFALFSLLIALFIACGDGSGGGGGGEPPTSISYTGKKGSDTYTLTITKNAARAAYQPVTDDDYTLTLSSSGVTYTSDGTIMVDGQTFTLIPLNETGSATVTVSGSSITEISGEGFDWNNDITFNTPGILDQSTEAYQGDIIMIGAKIDTSFGFKIYGTGTAIIEWGNGKTTNYTLPPSADSAEFIYPYFSYGPFDPDQRYTITINNLSGDILGLYCSKMGLTGLELNAVSEFEQLECSENNLKTLDISGLKKFYYLTCDYNELEELNIAGVPNLTRLDCESNKLKSLDLDDCRYLEYLNCAGNEIEELDASGLQKLSELSCAGNKLSSLSVTGCVSLSLLGCQKNQLSILNASGLEALEELWCFENEIADLSISGCSSILKTIKCEYNQLGREALTRLLNELPPRTGLSGNLNCFGNPGTGDGWGDLVKAIAEPKLWSVMPF